MNNDSTWLKSNFSHTFPNKNCKIILFIVGIILKSNKHAVVKSTCIPTEAEHNLIVWKMIG